MIEAIKNEYKYGKPDKWSYVLLCACMIMFGAWVYNINSNDAVAQTVQEEPRTAGLGSYTIEYIVETAPIPQKKPETPQWFKDKQFYDIAKFVIIDLEGGDQITKEPNGGLARYGINTKSHPEVNIHTLTKAQALAIAKKKYWNAVNADKLPSHVRLVAFDTAFHHGSGTANRFIRKAGYNPNAILNLRKQEYLRLVNANPRKYAKYKKGWFNRLNRVKQARL